MEGEIIEHYDAEVRLLIKVATLSTSERRPAVLLFPSWEGRGDFIERKAEEIAKLGFVACAIDPYGEGRVGKTRKECADLMTPLVSDRARLQRRVLSCFDLLSKIPYVDKAKVAAIGFCFGGLCALDLARSGAQLKGAVSFHGLLDAPDLSLPSSLSARVLVLHGYKDPMVSQEELLTFMKEMQSKGVDFQVHIFGRAWHAFTNPEAKDPDFGTVYDAEADRCSFEMAGRFLQEVLS